MSMRTEELSSLLSAMPAQFEKFRDTILKEAGEDWVKIGIGKGEYLFKQDDHSDAVFILAKGLLQVSITEKDGSEIDVAAIKEGEVIGEIGLMMGGKRTANVYASLDSQLIRLPKPVFERIAASEPRAIRELQGTIRRRN